jgi:hypothetical protein
MTMTLEIIRLRNDGTYRTGKIKPESQFPLHARDHKSKEAVSLRYKPQLFRNVPLLYKTVKELEKADAPFPETKPGGITVIAEEGSIYPISVLKPSLEPPTREELGAEVGSLRQMGIQNAKAGASKKDTEPSWQGPGFLFLVGLSVFMVLIMGMIAMTEIYMGDTSEGGQIGSVESTVPDTTKLE